MPIINNINNGYNNNNKKLSSKLTFEVGEKFLGKVVDKGDGKDVTIRTSDGWQFIAETDDNVNPEQLKLVKFQVEGYENGKLKLKIIQENTQKYTEEDENFNEIIDKEGLSKEDIHILKNMIKHNISLNRDNITQIKGLITFNANLNSDPEEMNNFIKSYLQSIDVDPESTKGQNIKEMLTEFLNEFKNMSSDEILTFIENNLELSKENIESFNNIFKNGFSIEKLMLKINDIIENNSGLNNQFDKTMNNINLVQNKAVDNVNVNESTSSLAAKVYSDNNPSNIDVLDILKTLAGKESQKAQAENNVLPKESEVKNKAEELNLPKEISEKLQNDKTTVKTIKNILVEEKLMRELSGNTKNNDSDESSKMRIEKFLSTQLDKDIKLTDSEFKEITQFVDKKLSEDKVMSENAVKSMPVINEDVKKEAKVSTSNLETINKKIIDLQNNDKTDIKTQIKERINNVADAVKNILSHMESDNEVYLKISTMLRNNINDVKVFNTMNNEYYYLNVPIQNNSQEYPCKLIIKDNRKDGKKIDSTNAKMVVNIKTINLGDVDGFITMSPKKINIQLQCDEKFAYLLNRHKMELVDGLSSVKANNNYITVSVKERKSENNIVSTREFFNDYNISNIDIMV